MPGSLEQLGPGIVAELAKLNPVTAIPGLVQQGQEAIDPVMQMIMQLIGQQGAGGPDPLQGAATGGMGGGGGVHPLTGAATGPGAAALLKQRMTQGR